MHPDKLEPSAECPPASETGTPLPASHTRSELIAKFRELAFQKTNPLAANLALVNGDLMAFAEGYAVSVSRQAPRPGGSADDAQRFERRVELHLRLVRQIDRLAKIDQQLES